MMMLENQWTVVSRVEEWKTCKSKESDRSWHRFGAGLGGSDAFVSISSQKNLERVISVLEKYCSYLRLGEIMAFYAF
jgi:hypothetical protein